MMEKLQFLVDLFLQVAFLGFIISVLAAILVAAGMIIGSIIRRLL